MSGDNLFEVMEELRHITADLRRTVYGDPGTHSRGLMDEFDAQRQDLAVIKHELHQVRSKRPNVAAWTAGYISFCVGGVFAIAALLNQLDGHQLMGLPANVALWLAVLFGAGALMLFLIGFGWLERG